MNRKTVSKVLHVLTALAGVLSLLLIQPVSAENRWGANYFPNIQLTTQDDKTVRFYDDLIKGRVVAINLIYTHCEYACPLETARLVQVQKILGDHVGKDIFFYSISIDPKRDTPSVMKAYMQNYHVGPGWTFLTGKKEDIDFLSRKLGLYTSPQETLDGHTPHLLIGNEPMAQWMRTSALDNPSFLARKIGEVLDAGNYSPVAGERNYAEAAAIKFDKGRYLFARHCAACHSIGHGDNIGPDLLGVTEARDRDWLVRIIQRPQELLKEKDPLATALFEQYKQVVMPDLRINNEQVEFLIRFLTAQTPAAKKNADKPRATDSATPESAASTK
jgi:protein SCO1